MSGRDEWLQRGIENGWITEPFCGTHYIPSELEPVMEQFYDGTDACVIVVHLKDMAWLTDPTTKSSSNSSDCPA